MVSNKFKFLVYGVICIFIIKTDTYVNAASLEPSYFELLPKLENHLIPAKSIRVNGTDVELNVEKHTPITFTVDVAKDGVYHIALDYLITESSIDNLILDVKINGENQFYESKNITLSALWKDESQIYSKNSYGNDIVPRPIKVYEWQTKLLNNYSYNMKIPYIFSFKQGENTITITNNAVAYNIKNINLVGKETYLNYDDYKNTNIETKSTPLIVEGEHYTLKSESYIRPDSGTTPNEIPYETGRMTLNHLSGYSFAVPSSEVTYNLEIPEDGSYFITFKYSQSFKKEMASYAKIFINDEILFEELSSYPFDYTGPKYVNETISIKGEPVAFYLPKGTHTLKLSTTIGNYYNTYENLIGLLSTINDIAMEIKIVTGNKVDKNRDWEIHKYIPTLEQDLLTAKKMLELEYEILSKVSNSKKAASVTTLKIAYGQLERFSEDLNYLVNNIDMLTQGSSSVTENISIILDDLVTQAFSIDRFYLTGRANDSPKATVSLGKKINASVKNLIHSYTTNYDEGGSIDDDSINVWVSFPNNMLDILRQKTMEEYETATGKKVNISILSDEQKLLLAISAGSAPDAVIGATVFRPFDFALRGAIYDLLQFDDFYEVMDNYHPEMLVPFALDKSIYALPLTADYKVTFYRKDILNNLNIEVPETWDDVIDILPTLARYDMSFNSPIANSIGLKHIGVTGGFIMQHEGAFYTEDGSGVALGDPNTVKAFKLMTDLHTKYGLPDTIPSFYNSFKKGVLPIGISDINTYLLLKYGTPELSNQWGIAPSIGVRNEYGKVNIYQNTVGSSSMIMNNSNKINDAWDYIKWFNSEDVQASFAEELQLKYGPTYIWNSANVKAFEKSNLYPEEDKQVILNQLNNTKDIPRNPAHFALEREISTAWNKVVYQGVAPRAALDDAIIISNREIAKKLKEFNYMDNYGNMIKPYETITGETIMSWRNNNAK
jgi:ABC-type glycerol-3-phosphate transport system substrate-binding protein